MKKTTKIVAVVLVSVMLCAILASCGKTLSGKYEASVEVAGVDLGGASYEFKGSKVTVSYKVLGAVKSFEGKYSIDGDKITFTFEDKDNVDSKYSGTHAFEQGKDDDGTQYIKVGAVKYKKAK